MQAKGRFAPSPTGPLHLGSLVTALASWLDARANGRQWLVRVEDLDPPREEPGAADLILQQLSAHGLHWDAWEDRESRMGVLFQSSRHDAYLAALETLIAAGRVYPCTCSRKRLQYAVGSGKTTHNPDGEIIYPGYCRPQQPERMTQPRAEVFFRQEDREGCSWRFRNDNGDDFLLRRADGFWAYHLAVVVDDGFQGITHILRGDDLLHAAPRHQALREALGLPQPYVQHVPVVKNDQGEKLSKQTKAPPLRIDSAEVIQLQLDFAWSYLEFHMPPSWLARVEGCWARLRQQPIKPVAPTC
ncbi:MAG: tRNA glutamyl-Q(34) synthetase GluQRS [Burkholderiaceae bacterium]|nr:tRNA glutamyl-Q(34) synthetase GluQRS [Burkholderiaceae bacterium]